jgi:pimeloyl-ACP methyl ester carboxylesterase
VTTQKSERIENYALRLKEIIDVLKWKTGAKKVTIVAHSMGGLVARDYLTLFGEDSVNKIIFINAPHQGVTARVEQLCALIGASKECEDLSSGSVFLSRLNAAKKPSIPLINIHSTGCPMGSVMGDGIVTDESSVLDGAENYLIKGNCTDQFQTDLHTNALDPDLYPEVFELLAHVLQNKTA